MNLLPMKADIFIPTTNNLIALSSCLKSLKKQTIKTFNILIIASYKDHEIEKLITDYDDLNIKYFVERGKGLVAAANTALKKSISGIFIRIDDDVVTFPGWYENIVKTFKSDKKIGAVSGPTLMTKGGLSARDSTGMLQKFGNSRNPFTKLLYKVYYNYIYEGKLYKVGLFLKSGAFSFGSNFESCLKIKKNIEVENLEACNFAVRRKILKSIGGFDPVFSRGLGEYHEADLAFKIRKLGFKLIFNPKIKVQHRVELSQKSLRPDSLGRIENFIIFYFRHLGIKDWNSFFRFSTNLLFQNMYYFYKFLATGSISQLGCFPGTITGLIKATKK